MTNRKLLYGYKIQDGGLSVVMEEAAVVSRVYSLYAASLSYQKISDTLNEEHIPYSRERPNGTSTRSSACWRIPATLAGTAIRLSLTTRCSRPSRQ
jgi:hypothetical protein